VWQAQKWRDRENAALHDVSKNEDFLVTTSLHHTQHNTLHSCLTLNELVHAS